MARSRTLIAAALVIAAGATASACTSDSSPTGTSKDFARTSARPSPAPSPPGSAVSPAPSSTPRPPSTENSAPVQQDTGQEAPSKPASGSSQADAWSAAAKNDVAVGQLIPKPDGQALWVPVSIHNRGRESASYTAVIRITGPNGFTSTVKVTTGPLPPGRTASQSHTAQDPSGTAVPSNPKAEIVDVVRTPA